MSYGPQVPALMERFPPRAARASWPATAQSREEVLERLLAPPFAAGSPSYQPHRRAGLVRVLDWLESFPGRSWQERWTASGAAAAGNMAWRGLCRPPRPAAGRGGPRPDYERLSAGRGMALLICGDVIRPSLPWLLAPRTPKKLAAQLARARDDAGFAALRSLLAAGRSGATTESTALCRIAVIMAAKGGLVSDITVGDCLELAGLLIASDGYTDASLYFYQVLHAMGVFPVSPPPPCGSSAPRDSAASSRWSTATASSAAASGTCWWTTCASARPPSTTPPCGAWPGSSASCSGGTWSCTILASAPCAWSPPSPRRGSSGS